MKRELTWLGGKNIKIIFVLYEWDKIVFSKCPGKKIML